MSSTRGRILWVLALALSAASPVRASILTFDGVPLDAPIPDEYGDGITATTDGAGYSYGMGNGFAPNVVVEYVPALTLEVWDAGYAGLINSLAHPDDLSGELVLRPDPGYLVVLNSFDVAARVTPSGTVRVLDEDDNVLFDSGDVAIPMVAGSLKFPPAPIHSATTLRIQYVGNLAIDNVNFDQAKPAIPLAGQKLVVVDKTVSADSAKVVFVTNDPAVSKGAGTDSASIQARMAIDYDEVGGSFEMPAGGHWRVNKATTAKYVNEGAPTGGGVKVALVKPGGVLKVVGKSLGDETLDISTAPTGPVQVTYTVTNGAESFTHVALFPTCTHTAIAGDTGWKLVCKGDGTVTPPSVSAGSDEVFVQNPQYSGLRQSQLNVLENDIAPRREDLRIVAIEQASIDQLVSVIPEQYRTFQIGLMTISDDGRQIIWDHDPPAGTPSSFEGGILRCSPSNGGGCFIGSDPMATAPMIEYTVSDGVNQATGSVTLHIHTPAQIPFPFNPSAAALNYIVGGPAGVVSASAPGTVIPMNVPLNIAAVTVNPVAGSTTLQVFGRLSCNAANCAAPVTFTATAETQLPAAAGVIVDSTASKLTLSSPLEVTQFVPEGTGFATVEVRVHNLFRVRLMGRTPPTMAIGVGGMGTFAAVTCHDVDSDQPITCPTQTVRFERVDLGSSVETRYTFLTSKGLGFEVLPCRVADPVGTFIFPPPGSDVLVGTIIQEIHNASSCP